ncbi:MAG: 30S ribosomal protein S4 [Candidatus Vogelbacteria bacterium CG10_big_fil_rev_8_21_14_0_10_45_14]|uniref:Small ribosomal subunit protein uS4 n=1 Tax=Candidatus Vogelbacteria bacterium CG10_big_fil_rev_8_21_14_0_10_45_14 TaxID=1975042 RepID=A0A2H0RKT3_9BACT|nr:MAG: 30S ribosomal protein S4 [Candidatus Vogelbacteria bacterium CG10_big_fil_rev_8_21_14_0_10_45_14]
MIRKPRYKVARRVGEAIYEKTQNPKFAAKQFPGKGRVQKHRSKTTEYGTQLTEKQKIRLSYGVTEKAMQNIMKTIRGQKGSPPELLMQGLERRMDNVVYRAGLGKTRIEARQLVAHGHFTVNGRVCRIPSRRMKIGDVVSLKKSSAEKDVMKALPAFGKHTPQKWIVRDGVNATVRTLPQMADADTTLLFAAVTEFYSRN